MGVIMSLYQFSPASERKLVGVHPDLVRVARGVLNYLDIAVVYGVRTPHEQAALFSSGASKTLNSKHLRQADGFGHALDLAPVVNHTIPWTEAKYFYYLAGVVLTVAQHEGVRLRWGGDWNSNGNFDDQNFNDLVHFELVTQPATVTA